MAFTGTVNFYIYISYKDLPEVKYSEDKIFYIAKNTTKKKNSYLKYNFLI